MAVFATYGHYDTTGVAEDEQVFLQVRGDDGRTRVRSIMFRAEATNPGPLTLRLKFSTVAGLYSGQTDGTQWWAGAARSPEWYGAPYARPTIFNDGPWVAANGDTDPLTGTIDGNLEKYWLLPGETVTFSYHGDEEFLATDSRYFCITGESDLAGVHNTYYRIVCEA